MFKKSYPHVGYAGNFLSGFIIIGPVVIYYGENVMHWSVEITTKNGYLCFRLPIRCFGRWYPLYCYYSPDGTPANATKWFWGKH